MLYDQKGTYIYFDDTHISDITHNRLVNGRQREKTAFRFCHQTNRNRAVSGVLYYVNTMCAIGNGRSHSARACCGLFDTGRTHVVVGGGARGETL